MGPALDIENTYAIILLTVNLPNNNIKQCSTTSDGLYSVSDSSVRVSTSTFSTINLVGGTYTKNSGAKTTSVLYVNDYLKATTKVRILSGTTFENNIGVLTNELYFPSIFSLDVEGVAWKSDS